MSPITKENEVLTPAQNPTTTASSSAGFRPDETASRPQPVALEVPVTVNGARTAEGSDKREPFSETTKTVLVFGNGAVLRLLAPVSPGQLLFLTNEKTKKEVVCQVVKSKNYRNVSGYVELEFTEAVVGFWGMRFPTDRVAAQPSAQTPVPVARVTPTAPPPSVVAKAPTAPVLSAVPKLPEPAPSQVQALPSPVAQVPVIEAAKPILPAVPEPPVTSLEAAALFAAGPVSNQLESPAGESPSLSASLASSMMNLLSSPELPPAAAPTSVSPQPVPFPANQRSASGENSTEELKLQAARLQEQLSGLVFGGAPEAKPSPKALSNDDNGRIASKLLDIAKTEVTPVKSTAPKTVPPPVRSSLDSEEVKIPSWLEPLARNAATPSPTQEPVEQERATEASEIEAYKEVPEEAPPASVLESASEAQLPGIGSLLPFDEEVSARERSSGGSKTGLWIGVAAAVVLAAAGAWYFMRPAASVPGTVVQGSAASAVRTADRSSGAVSAVAVQPAAQPAPQPVPQNPLALPEPPAKPAKSETTSESPLGKSAQTPQPIPAVRDDARNSVAAIPASDTERIPKPTRSPVAAVAPAEPAPKKQSIGEVHLASPMVNRPATTADEGEAPSISSINSDASSANLGEGLAGASSQPTAPEALLPAGGDVTPAKLVSTVSPVYPAIARSQHIEGDVRIDALINENGKVTTMKVISGPALLHQAAMEALRQWKYTPATLDGKPVPMHLSVTLKFRAK